MKGIVKIYLLTFLILFCLSFGVKKTSACEWYGCSGDDGGINTGCQPGMNGTFSFRVNCNGCDSCESGGGCGGWDSTFCCGSGCGGDCLLTGTEVATPSGSIKVENVKSDDVVQSFNPENKTIETGKVATTSSYTRDEYYVLKTKSGKELEVTATHPILCGESQSPKTLREQLDNIFLLGKIYFIDGLILVKKIVINN